MERDEVGSGGGGVSGVDGGGGGGKDEVCGSFVFISKLHSQETRTCNTFARTSAHTHTLM